MIRANHLPSVSTTSFDYGNHIPAGAMIGRCFAWEQILGSAVWAVITVSSSRVARWNAACGNSWHVDRKRDALIA